MLILLIMCLFLAGCVSEMAISGIAITGTYLGYQHSKSGGITNRFRNFNVESNISVIWQKAKVDEPFLQVIAINGIPVIVGSATSADSLENAQAIAFMKYDTLKCIADSEITGNWNSELETKIRWHFLRSFSVSGRNFHIKAMKNKVWLVGVAKTEAEKNKAIEIAEKTDGVANVKHHIIIYDDSLPSGSMERTDD